MFALFFVIGLSGCGGGGGGANPGINTNPSTGPAPDRPTRTTPVTFRIHWGERSRTLAAPASALSAVLTLARANPNGNDFTFTANRDAANLAAPAQDITTSNPAGVGRWEMQMRFHAEPDGGGAVVGVAGAVVTIGDDGTGIGAI